MNTTVLEARLSTNPKSPLFARLASCYLKQGETDRAVNTCIEGLKTFPEYSTGHLVLGQCYEMLGRNVEALVEYRRVLKAVPDNVYVRDLLQNVEQREQEAFRTFAEERARKLTERRGTLTADGFVSGTPASTESGTNSDQGDGEVRTPGSGMSKIVTATLAEIYATQGEYEEAIQAYRRLLRERPVESERYVKRIVELEELEREQKAEVGT